MELILPALNANSFKTGSGKKYIIYPSISAGRFPIREICMVELQNTVSASGHKKELNAIWDVLNKGKMADASVLLNNLINSVDRLINKGLHPLFKSAPCLSVRQTKIRMSGARPKPIFFSISEAFCASLFQRLGHRFLG